MSLQKSNPLEVAANILTIVVALVFLGLIAERYVFRGKAEPKSPIIGDTVKVDGFDPSRHPKNVLLILRKGCRFCEESVGFYKDLIARSSLNNVQVLVVFPENTPDLKNYLTGLGLTEISILFAELSSLDVDGTPTIIVTDTAGTILGTWLGILSEERKTEVMNFLAS